MDKMASAAGVRVRVRLIQQLHHTSLFALE
jgi:hypothetical protein